VGEVGAASVGGYGGAAAGLERRDLWSDINLKSLGKDEGGLVGWMAWDTYQRDLGARCLGWLCFWKHWDLRRYGVGELDWTGGWDSVHCVQFSGIGKDEGGMRIVTSFITHTSKQQ